MSPRTIGLDEDLNQYVLDHTSAPSAVQEQLIERTMALGGVSRMQISPDQGEFLTSMVALLQPSTIVEVGTFTGYSSLAMAMALPPGGRLIACDISTEWTNVAREHWDAAGVADRIELHIAPATETLAAMGDDVVIDMAFIDADKTGYASYYEAILGRLSERGVMFVDNTLWSGAVADDTDTSDDTVALRAFNDMVVADDRVRCVQLAIGDGVTMIRRA